MGLFRKSATGKESQVVIAAMVARGEGGFGWVCFGGIVDSCWLQVVGDGRQCILESGKFWEVLGKRERTAGVTE